MNNKKLQQAISNEILAMINTRKSLMLSSLDNDGFPYASYAPYASGDDCLYILISELAVHAKNLQQEPKASVLIIEDEDSAEELFARLRIVYKVLAEKINIDTDEWHTGLANLTARHGERIPFLSSMSDFKLFKLRPVSGRYIKGFGKAYQISGGSLAGSMNHIRDGHKS
jgi:putative heme iron utilization protein